MTAHAGVGGRRARARALARPHPDACWTVEVATADRLFGRYGDLVVRFDRYGGSFEEEPARHLLLAAAHGQLDEAAAAAAALGRQHRVRPCFDADVFARNRATPAHRRVLRDGPEQAGLRQRCAIRCCTGSVEPYELEI
jgi:hypothetical protein